MSRKLAADAALELPYEFVERKKRSIARLQQDYKAAVLVAGHDRFELYREGMEKPFFFHPNSAAFRLKRILQGGSDPLIEVARLQKGDSFLDCTLGLASDSIIASYAVGDEGRVVGLEGDLDVAFIVQRGLLSITTQQIEMKNAMARIEVNQTDAIAFLEREPDNSWDVVYIDPMFSAPIDESSNFTPLRQVGLTGQLTKKWVTEAYRVCKRKVIVKEHFDSPIFEKFNFQRIVRPNTKFHFGYLSKE